MKSLKYLCILFVLAFSLFTVHLHSKEPDYIYHRNGALAWNYDVFSPFFHNNAKIAWNGVNHPKTRDFSYETEVVAWKGYTYKEYPRSSRVFDRNGNKIWDGASYKELYFSCEPSTIYHSNNQIAWKGALYKDPYFSIDPCVLYHSNGKVAWQGASANETYFSDEPCTFYHSNGAVAWRGSFASKKSNPYSSGLYYDNGQLAWSGKQNDPLYNEKGGIINAETEAFGLPLGEESWLHVFSNGTWLFNLALGEANYLQFSNKNDNPVLLVNLGPGYYLKFFPHSGNKPIFSCYDLEFKINYRK
jgi:hypothetical protein